MTDTRTIPTRWPFNVQIIALCILCGAGASLARADTVHVWEKVEIILHADNQYPNPYADVEVWVDLKGPGFDKRCCGFWDADNTFRVRVLAVGPGTWTWTSGSNQSDAGLNGKAGQFNALEWSDAEKEKNPCRRGMIKASANGHAFEYADGTPFFLLGDTWWSAGTFRYRWYDHDKHRPIGPKAGFKDFVRFRRKQGFNCIAMIAAFGNWANDDKPPRLETSDGTQLRSAWPQAGTKSAKEMTDEDGNRVFIFPGKVPGYENYFPDVDRINPAYFRNLDQKIDYLNAHGFVPFIEVARRDIGPAWHKFYQWPDSYARYLQYIWSRYQANICLFSPIHFDSRSSLAAEHWNVPANMVIDKYGHPPFGTLAGCNPAGSSLKYFDHRTNAKWITFHQIGNSHRHKSYAYLTEIFNASPPLPGINGEPYYAGMHGELGGSDGSARNCRSHMYGSVLSGGYAGHIYGAGDRAPKGGAMWAGEVEDVEKPHIWDAIKWPSAGQMRHLRTFVFSEGRKYQLLEPRVELLSPNKSEVKDFAGWDGCVGWAYCSRTADKGLFLLYFEKGCAKATLSGALPNANYAATWFDPRQGVWLPTQGQPLLTDSQGKVVLPTIPTDPHTNDTDWGLKLTLAGTR
ncbi:MAG: apiosidase-like domain-containing protein [Planctomycetota bacterium]